MTSPLVAKMVKEGEELSHIFIRNNWTYLSDQKGNTFMTIGDCMLVVRIIDEGTEIKYSAPRVGEEHDSLKDFRFVINISGTDLVQCDIPGSVEDAAERLSELLAFARQHDASPRNENVDDKKAQSSMKTLEAMTTEQVFNFLKNTEVKRNPNDVEPTTFTFDGCPTPITLLPKFRSQAISVLYERARMGEMALEERAVIEEPLEEYKEQQLVRTLENCSDTWLTGFFQTLHLQMGGSFTVPCGPVGNPVTFGRKYLSALGKEVARRLAQPRVTENMLVIDLGDEKVVSPINAMVRFTQAIQRRIEEGPTEPEIKDSRDSNGLTLSKEWVQWFRRTHSCGFDVAWEEGARRLMTNKFRKEEALFKHAWHPNIHNVYQIDYTKRLTHAGPDYQDAQ